MRLLVLGLTALLVALLTATLAPRPAAACSCASAPLDDYADEVPVAFTGTQVDRVELGGQIGGEVLLTFEVDQVYTGPVGSTLTARTAADSAACGVDFGGQGQVALAAFGSVDEPSLGLCGSLVSEGDLEAVFGVGADPDPEVIDVLADDGTDDGGADGGGLPWAAVLAAVVAVAAVVGLYFAGTVRLSAED